MLCDSLAHSSLNTPLAPAGWEVVVEIECSLAVMPTGGLVPAAWPRSAFCKVTASGSVNCPVDFTQRYDTYISLKSNSHDQRRAEAAGLDAELGAVPAAGTYLWSQHWTGACAGPAPTAAALASLCFAGTRYRACFLGSAPARAGLTWGC